MEKIFIPDKVVLYLEPDGQTGTFHNLATDKKAYVNGDAIEIIKLLTQGMSLVSFFPQELSQKERTNLIQQSEGVISDLTSHGFLTGTRPEKSGRIKQVRSNPPLRVIFIETTKQCNLRCKHCYVPDCDSFSGKNQITSRDMNCLISQIDDLGVMELQLTGGEFFILPNALEILKEVQGNLVPCSIFTNGTLMTSKIFRYISENNYGLIFYVSLDGHQEVHDVFRRSRGSYQKAVESIKRLLQIGCDVRINTAIGRHNINQMGQFIDFVKNEFGVLHRLVTVEPIGRADFGMTIAPEEFANLLKDSNNTFEFLDSHDSISDWATPACGMGSSMLFIDAYGNVSFCPTLTQKENPDFLAGNIKNSSIKDIWENSPVFKKFKGMQCVKVSQCKFKELCKGGCRSRAYLSTRNLNSPDLAMCSLYHAR